MTPADFQTLTVTAAAQGLRQGRWTAAELERASRERLRAVNGKLHAFLRETPELSTAQAVDQSDQPRSVLAGLPVALKDNLATAGVETTAGSKILSGYRPARDATVVSKLRRAGVNVIGKTNLDEFAMGASTEQSAFGPTRNPCDLTRVPGGSSGGSAAAVAAGTCVFALGSDTGGSVRHPAAFCGIVGLKPSYGRVSRSGLIALTSSTDVVGVLAKTVEDAAVVLSEIAGQDAEDATTQPVPVPAYAAGLTGSLKGVRVGIPAEYFPPTLDHSVAREVRAAIRELGTLGATVTDCSLPSTDAALWVYYIVTPAEASTNLSRYDGIRFGPGQTADRGLAARYAAARGQGFGPEPKRRIILGTYALSAGYYQAYYDKAQRVRRIIREEFDRVFASVDVLATPTTPTVAFPFGAKPDPLAMYLSDIFLVGASLAGLPAVSVPCGTVDGLPVGLQLIGRPFEEELLLRVAARYEERRGPLPIALAV